MSNRILLHIDALIAAVEHARITRPSRRLESAYEYLAPLEAVELDASGCMVVQSATWSNTFYRVNERGCNCPAHRACWHQEAWNLVRDMQRRANTPARKAAYASALADLMEAF